MYICLLHEKSALVTASRYNYNAARPYSNTYSKSDHDGKGFRMRATISNFENFYFRIEIHCKTMSMYICVLPQIQLLCQQVAETTMQIVHIAIHIPSLIRIERCSSKSPQLQCR